MCPDSYRDADVRMCGCSDVAMCRCADLPMWVDTPCRIHCFWYFLKYKFIYHSLKRSDKSVNPLNPGSNRRCQCANVRMLADHVKRENGCK
jgi:hypothetical protein